MKAINKIFIYVNVFLICICLFLSLIDLYNGGNSFGYYLSYYIALTILNKLI